eukprot:COSAG03_NODE_9467_length_717_cov_3.865696_1_plen_38_part_10
MDYRYSDAFVCLELCWLRLQSDAVAATHYSHDCLISSA